jgi:Cu2+-exporting ATPase
VEGAEDRYCCTGCALAAEIIARAGLTDAPEAALAQPSRPEVLGGDWSAIPVTTLPDGRCEARLVVDGIRCTSCTWVVEHVLQATDGVSEAHVSYATGRAIVTFDPQKMQLRDVAGRVAAVGYRPLPVDAAPQADRDLLTRLGVAAFAASNVMLLAASVYTGWWDGMEPRFAALFRWTSLALATPVALWSAEPFLKGAWNGLRARALGMDVPIALGVIVLYTHGLVSTFLGQDAYLDSLTMLVALLLAGRLLEARGRKRGAEAATALAAALPTRARRVTDSGVEEVAASALLVGERVVVGLGDEVPADGTVVDGHGEVRMALLTGEAEPVAVAVGGAVVAGATVARGSLTVRVDRVGEDTLGRRMAAQISEAVDRGLTRTPSDRLAPIFTALSVGLATAGFIGWCLHAGLGGGVTVAVAVLVVACPCALGLSWPLAAAAGLGALGRRGVVLRSGDVLLRLLDVDEVAVDKTGTVTVGVPRVTEASDEVLRVAAALEAASRHPIARAVLDEAQRRGVPFAIAADVEERPGEGVVGTVDGRRVALRAGAAGEVHLVEGERVIGRIRLRDVARQDARDAISALRRLGVRVTLLTGDHRAVADEVAAGVGIEHVVARQRPEDKAAWIKQRRAEGHRVLYVGDGLNDGPALAAADASLAMRDGATPSLLAADGVLAEGHLAGVVAALRGARAVRSTVRLTLGWSVSYNATAVSLALAGWVDPLVAAVLMPFSSAVVIAASRLVERRVHREERWT